MAVSARPPRAWSSPRPAADRCHRGGLRRQGHLAHCAASCSRWRPWRPAGRSSPGRSEIASYRASAAVKAELRRSFLARAVELGPRWLAGRRSAELTALATEGIEALDGYFSKYLPQLILAAIVPVAVLVRVGLADPVAGLTIAATLPLIPLFGALVGKMTGAYAEQRWRASPCSPTTSSTWSPGCRR